MKILQKVRQTSLLKKFLIAALASVFLFTVVGFFVLPPIIKSVVIKKASQALHRQVSIREVKVNPFVLSVRINGLLIKERNRPETFLSFDGLYVNLQSASIFKRGIIIKEFILEKPYINVERNEDMSYNFSDLLTGPQPKPQAESKPLKFSVNNIQILNGSADFMDGPKHTKHKIRDVHVKIPFISNLPYYIDTYVQPSFAATVNDNSVSVTGKTKPFAGSRETSVDLDMKDINIPHYLEYVPFKMNFNLLSGYLSAKAEISYAEYADREPMIRLNGNISARDIRVEDTKKNPLLNIPVVTVNDAEVDLAKKELVIKEISSEKGMVAVRRMPGGKLNVESLLGPESSQEKTSGQAPESKDEKQWLFTLKKFVANEYEVKAEDHTASQPVKISAEQIKLEALDISTGENSKGSASLEFVMGKKGAVSVNGDVGINPPSADLKLDIKRLGIIPFQPYFTDRVKIIVTNGEISAKGSLLFAYAKDKNPKITYKGNASLYNFSSVDKATAEEFLKWKSFYLSNIDAGYNPLYVRLKGIALTDFYSRIIINPEGTMNLQSVMEEGAEQPEGKQATEKKTGSAPIKKPAAAMPVKIDAVTLQGGTINFSDKHVKPNYSANLLEIGGRISGLSSEENKFADVDLRGKLENYAPLEITGKINPLREDLYVDLKVDFKDMDLSPLTPYSGKYLGYTIQKGKLFLNLQYLIVKKKLDSQNRVFLDQFTLGDSVESPDATKLPVKLAIALLKNRKGEIQLDLPVTGEIDDPKFSIGAIIIKILVNILVKAATSPFALLGAIFGGGEELSYVDFDYGSYALNEASIKKMDTLVKALSDRPALKIEISGHVDLEKDKEGLRQYLFEKKLKAQKLREMIKQGREAIPVDDVKIEQDEYPKYLKMAYKQEKFPKPRTILGFAKDLPVPEMEKLMLTHIEVKEEDLRELASQRALRVKDYLLKSGQIEPERVFLIEPKTLQPEKKEKLKDSRVDFKLK